jgi:anti-sigma regulatory factor (Ser/Thr protein kinase)
LRHETDADGGTAHDEGAVSTMTHEPVDQSARLTVPGDSTSPRHVRQWLEEQLRHAAAGCDAISDLRLIASELCANAVEHVRATSIEVTISCQDPSWFVLTVTTRAAHSPPQTSTWELASPEAASGRGLGIVRSLSDRVTVETIDGEATITCWRRRHRMSHP